MNRSLLVLFAAFALASCAKDAQPTKQEPVRKSGERDINDWAASKGGSGYTQDTKGNWTPKDAGKRSSFETQRDSNYTNKANAMFGGSQQYKTGDYKKTTFWGAKEYSGNKEYAGNTDGSRFQKSSQFGDSKARESSTLWSKGEEKFATKNFAKKEANEQNGKQLDKPSDAETDERRRVYGQPDIIDWREQRKLSVDQTKGLLGR